MTQPLIRVVRRWIAAGDPTPDADLLHRYAARRDESAFAALVDRYGPLVLGTARRVAGAAADDVFQATFFALSRDAGALRNAAGLPAWLHRTAYRCALTSRRAAARRTRAERRVRLSASRDPLDELTAREFLAALDEELARLPTTLRVPLILCGLEGLTQEEAAMRIGTSPDAVRGRLERGRRRLRDRLARRGLTLASVVLLAPRPAVALVLRELTLRGIAGQATPAMLPTGGMVLLALTALSVGWLGAGLWPRATSEPTAPPAPPSIVKRFGYSPLRIDNATLALSRDESAIITVSPNGTACQFDAKTGELRDRRQIFDRALVEPHLRWPAQLAGDGQTALFTERQAGELVLVLVDVPTGKELRRFASRPGQQYLPGSFTPDGRQVAVIVRGGEFGPAFSLVLYELVGDRTRVVTRANSTITGMRFTADGRRVLVAAAAAAKNHSRLTLTDVMSGQSLWSTEQRSGSFALSPDGRYAVVAVPGATNRFEERDSDTKPGFTILETDAKTGQPTERFADYPGVNGNLRVEFAPDSRTLVLTDGDHIATWDVPTRTQTAWFPTGRALSRDSVIQLGGFSADGRTVLASAGELQRFHLDTGKRFWPAPPDDALGGPAAQLAFTPDGRELVGYDGFGRAACWDVRTGQRLRQSDLGSFGQLAPTTDGPRLLEITQAGKSQRVTIHDPRTGRRLKSVSIDGATDPDKLRGLAQPMLTDGRTLHAAWRKQDITAVAGFAIDSGKRTRYFEIAATSVSDRPPFSPCGRWLVIGATVYDATDGHLLRRLSPSEGELPSAVVWFSPDGSRIAAHTGRAEEPKKPSGALVVWDATTGAVVVRLADAAAVAAVEFSPTGRRLALLDGCGVRLLDLPSGQLVASYAAADVAWQLIAFGSHNRPIAFSPDGRTLATGHRDGSVTLWAVPP